jgi:hypothetical protein
MAYLIASDMPLFWSAEYSGEVFISDIAEIGGKIGIPPALIEHHSTDANEFLGQNIGHGGSYDPLPEAGEWVEANHIYSYNGGLVICRQSHFRTIYSPEETLALFIVYRENQAGVLDWVAGESVLVGYHRIYNGIEYVCLQAHVTQSDWTPDVTSALWQIYNPGPVGGEWQPWTAYAVNDEVTYLGLIYRCLQAHTSQPGWEPPNVPALWLLI